jgi:hypothetical protein
MLYKEKSGETVHNLDFEKNGGISFFWRESLTIPLT